MIVKPATYVQPATASPALANAAAAPAVSQQQPRLQALQILEKENRLLKLRLQQQQELMGEGFRAFQQSAEQLRIKIKGEAQSYLANIFESLPVGVIVTDLQGCITAINQAGTAMLGHPAKRLVGSLAEQTFDPLTLSAKSHHNNSHKRILPWSKPNGDVRILQISTTSLLSHGKPLGFILNLEDITLLKQLQEEAQRQERLAAMGQVAANIAHEIRNPLGGIELFASLIKKNLPATDQNQLLLTHISSAVANMNQLLTNVLQYTKPPKIQPRKVDLHQLLSEVIEFHRCMAQQNQVELHTHLGASKQFIRADASQLKQCAQNLLLNAIQAAENPACVTIRSHSKKLTAAKDLRLLQADKPLHVWEVQFLNNGGTIPSHTLKRIFDPFFSTKVHGTGLGLTIVQQIVRTHQGHISAKNIVGQGACFTLRIPAWQDQGDSSPQHHPMTPNPASI